MSRRSRLYGRPCLCWGGPPVPISVPENKTQAAAIAGVSRKIKLIVSYAFSVILLVGSGGATYSPVLKCTIIVKNSIPPRLAFFPSVRWEKQCMQIWQCAGAADVPTVLRPVRLRQFYPWRRRNTRSQYWLIYGTAECCSDHQLAV